MGPALPMALSDQRVAELLRLQELLADQSLSEANKDAWVLSGPSFTVQAIYTLRPGRIRGPAPFAEVPFGVEASSPSEDQGIRLAPATTAIVDEVLVAAHGLGFSLGMPVVR